LTLSLKPASISLDAVGEPSISCGVFQFRCKAALKHFKKGSVIVNTTSVTAYKGSPHLLDYCSTKGAIAAFTRSLSQALAKKGIRVNGVAPGPIWPPLIPSTILGVLANRKNLPSAVYFLPAMIRRI
jgi:NAD(P)-dependent dehydrogenase (short-subunit alcohol dehydrogenase family)